jgi:hypothetical protein
LYYPIYYNIYDTDFMWNAEQPLIWLIIDPSNLLYNEISKRSYLGECIWKTRRQIRGDPIRPF